MASTETEKKNDNCLLVHFLHEGIHRARVWPGAPPRPPSCPACPSAVSPAPATCWPRLGFQEPAVPAAAGPVTSPGLRPPRDRDRWASSSVSQPRGPGLVRSPRSGRETPDWEGRRFATVRRDSSRGGRSPAMEAASGNLRYWQGRCRPTLRTCSGKSPAPSLPLTWPASCCCCQKPTLNARGRTASCRRRPEDRRQKLN